MLTGFLVSCDKDEKEDRPNICGVENPLTDLEWLKDLIQTYEENAENGHKVRIYQSTYGNNQTCFIIEPCSGCPDAGYNVVLCDGTNLCYGGTLVEPNTCEGLNIDYENQKLIYELN